MDCPGVQCRIAPHRAWWEVFQVGPKCIVYFFDTVLLSAHVERVSVSRMRDFYSQDSSGLFSSRVAGRRVVVMIVVGS